MVNNTQVKQDSVLLWHRKLLVAAAIFTTLLIAMGGILCVTQSIRTCPDWPGCFGRVVPPAETGPVLEYTHRLLAGISSLLIVSTAVLGLVRAPKSRWISIPPLVAFVLLLEVSYFGAQVVLRGLSPGWATVDVGSALLVVALMVTAAVKANLPFNKGSFMGHPIYNSPFSRLVLVTAVVVYTVLVSGILVAGNGSITGCLGWPFYNLKQFQLDGLTWGNILRLAVSIAGVGLLVVTVVLAWHRKQNFPNVFRTARWLGLVFALEVLLQVLLQVFGLLILILVMYTVVAAVMWALLIVVLILTGLEASTG